MSHFFIYIISFLSIAGVIIRPFKFPEAIWAISGALILLLFGLITTKQALHGVGEGLDVYLFLTGMMLLSETAREEGLFDYLAARAIQMAKGSPIRLFGLVYIVGVFITIFLSNDAAAVVLTPAVIAATRSAKIEKPLPYLFICAFIANAASFMLPISNPANLVIYGKNMPSLTNWLKIFTIPSLVCIVSTYFLLLKTQKKKLPSEIANTLIVKPLTNGSKVALMGISFTALAIIIFSYLGKPLGLPTCIVGVFSSLLVVLSQRKNPLKIIKGVSWGVLPLVAGLFVIVEALKVTHLIDSLGILLQQHIQKSMNNAAWGSGLISAFGCNMMNNLPAGLVTSSIVQHANTPELIKSAALIGIDLGPNLSVTGSLATILWLTSLKREGLHCSYWDFFKIGAIVMTIPLLLTLGILIFSS